MYGCDVLSGDAHDQVGVVDDRWIVCEGFERNEVFVEDLISQRRLFVVVAAQGELHITKQAARRDDGTRQRNARMKWPRNPGMTTRTDIR